MSLGAAVGICAPRVIAEEPAAQRRATPSLADERPPPNEQADCRGLRPHMLQTSWQRRFWSAGLRSTVTGAIYSEAVNPADAAGEPVHIGYSSRAMVKLIRARELFHSLEMAIGDWNQQHRLMAPARSPYDGVQCLEFFRPVELADIPWTAWESIFHDGVHNLRVALDTFCFEVCHLEGPAPEPDRIHFPITNHPNQWESRTRSLNTIPRPLLERMRQCQPWGRQDQLEPDPLTIVSRIDNLDKHRAAGVSFDAMPMGQWALRQPKPVPPHLGNSLDWPLTPWMRLTVEPPIDRGFAALMPVMAVPIFIFANRFANLADAQRWLYRETHRIIEYVASGQWPTSQFDRFLPEPTWSNVPTEFNAPFHNGTIDPPPVPS